MKLKKKLSFNVNSLKLKKKGGGSQRLKIKRAALWRLNVEQSGLLKSECWAERPSEVWILEKWPSEEWNLSRAALWSQNVEQSIVNVI